MYTSFIQPVFSDSVLGLCTRDVFMRKCMAPYCWIINWPKVYQLTPANFCFLTAPCLRCLGIAYLDVSGPKSLTRLQSSQVMNGAGRPVRAHPGRPVCAGLPLQHGGCLPPEGVIQDRAHRTEATAFLLLHLRNAF